MEREGPDSVLYDFTKSKKPRTAQLRRAIERRGGVSVDELFGGVHSSSWHVLIRCLESARARQAEEERTTLPAATFIAADYRCISLSLR